MDDIGLIEINNPPVNACGASVRQGLVAAIDALEPKVAAVAIYGAGRCFIAGADITEFGKPIVEPNTPEVCHRIEACTKPVVAALHGATLGGGLEVALGCHARVALPDLLTGFPEVTLGVLPGAGGTQRGPRAIGIAATLDLAMSGRRIGAEEALSLGLIDRIAEGAPRDVALAAAQDAISGALKTRRLGTLKTTPDEAALSKARAEALAKQAHLYAPHRIVDCVAQSTGDFIDGMAYERAAFMDCIASPQRAGLIHAFFAERAVAKIPEATETPRDIGQVGVIGGGTMGSGIATSLLLAGLPVVLLEQDQAALERARDTITKNLDGAVKRGKLDGDRRSAILCGALTLATDYGALGAADLVIEAVFEDMSVKKQVFAALDAVMKPGAILATNTSYLDVDEIAAATQRPSDVIGLHFFSPAHIMRLLEVVVGDQTAPNVVATGFALAKKLRKIAVRSGVCDGFIGNRILNHTRKVADYLLMDGATPAQVDAALTSFGFAMGPFAVLDLAGLDIGWAARKRRAPTRPAEERYVEIADRICEAGWFGRKAGRGYHLYGEATGENPEVLDIIEDERRKNGIIPRGFSAEEIVARYMTAMICEAARIIEDGTALRPIDVDAVKLFGYGFPRHHGGPLHYADHLGASEIVSRITTYAADDSYYWQVPGILSEMAATGGTFSDRN
ncbi:MAG: 3-hydroxyacyl-CoA dehydrogenase NAD-binding domain-containing protein [Pseudomonadota bacterium]